MISSREIHLLKALFFIERKNPVLGFCVKEREDNEEQLSNAKLSIVLTVFGIIICFREVQF